MLSLVGGISSVHDLIQAGDPSVRLSIEYEKPSFYTADPGIADVADIANPSPELQKQFIDTRSVTPPGRSLIYLRDCIVLPNAAIITAGGAIIRESCFPYGDRRRILKMFNPWIVEEDGQLFAQTDSVEHVDSPAIYLREHGEMGFFHWMHSVFPRIDVMRSQQLSHEFSLLVQNKAHYQVDALKLYGLDGRKIIQPSTSNPQHFDELLFPYPLVENGDFWLRPPSVKDFYANLPVPAGPQHKRIYVTREDAGMRRLVNEAAVLELTQRHGFVAVEVGKLTFTEQLALFRGADVVMGVHGAGLAHVVSMSPSAGVLEILHPRRFWPTYRALSARCNLIYAFAVGEDPGPSMSGDSFDFNIDLSKLERVLSVLIHKHKEVQTNGTP